MMYNSSAGGRKNARWSLKHKVFNPKAGTKVGWARAKQLANEKSLSKKDVLDMWRWFRRHKKNKTVPYKYKNCPYMDRGYLMWMAWGGDAEEHNINRIYNTIKSNR